MRFGARAAGQAASEAADRRARGGRVYSVVVELESARAGAAPDLSDVIEQVESGGGIWIGWRRLRWRLTLARWFC